MLNYAFSFLMSREKEKVEMVHGKYSHFGYLKNLMGRLGECAQ